MLSLPQSKLTSLFNLVGSSEGEVEFAWLGLGSKCADKASAGSNARHGAEDGSHSEHE